MVAVLLFLLPILRSAAEMRPFSLHDGWSFEAELVGFNARLGQVELKRMDGRRVKVKPEIFIQKDQDYIREWVMLEGFRNTGFFKVSCRKKLVEKWKKENALSSTQYSKYVYHVVLKNNNECAIENLKAEYRIFFEQQENRRSKDGFDRIETSHAHSGSLKLNRVLPKDKKEFTTEAVVVSSFDFNSTDYYMENGNPQTAKGEVKGIWLRLTVATKSGRKAVRDICEPSIVKDRYEWPH